MLTNKNIVLGISGGIAAYKTPELVRQFVKHGANVRVVLTQSAHQFVSELSLQTVSNNLVSSQLFDNEREYSMSHIDLAKWADCIVIAPCTANIIAKLNAGIADDLLTTLCLASSAPVMLAPAMNQQMFRAPVTQQNLASLKQRGYSVIGPEKGEQACGDNGFGRMSELDVIVKSVIHAFQYEQILSRLSITITAGPTQEAIDPVRYLSNHSSGKMGFAIAEQAAKLGANVTLITGPVNLKTPDNVERINVISALEMQSAAINMAKKSNIFIGCAAVADYRMESIADKKIKKQENCDELTLKLVKNPDIIANIAKLDKKERPFVVGFAAETDHLEEHAMQKLADKHLDMICANDVSNQQIGFNADENELVIFSQSAPIRLEKNSKQIIAKQLLLKIKEAYFFQNRL